MVVFHLVVKTWFQLDLGWGMILLMGVVGSLFGQLGDLSFSVIKREFGIKDYGAIFPATAACSTGSTACSSSRPRICFCCFYSCPEVIIR